MDEKIDKPKPSSKDEPITPHLLKLVRSKEHPEDMHARLQASEHDEELHIDERWLMTYADKMTILCGFFILLFSISTLDPVKLQKVQESAEKSFGKPNVVENSKMVKLEELEKVKQEKVRQQLKIQELEKKRVELEAVLSKTTATSAAMEQIRKRVVEIEQRNAEIEKRNTELEQVLEARMQKKEVDPLQMEKIQKENEQLKREVTSVKEVVVRKEEEIKELKEELKVTKSNVTSSDFVAFVMSWPTRDHDIDLYVEDPEKKVFDFKRREYSKHPGLLVLDTRQGPGVEVWQSDKVIPGIYTFTYMLYNTYGNQAASSITGTLFTSKGRIELPTTKLVPDSNKMVKYRISIDEKGKAKLLKN